MAPHVYSSSPEPFYGLPQTPRRQRRHSIHSESPSSIGDVSLPPSSPIFATPRSDPYYDPTYSSATPPPSSSPIPSSPIFRHKSILRARSQSRGRRVSFAEDALSRPQISVKGAGDAPGPAAQTHRARSPSLMPSMKGDKFKENVGGQATYGAPEFSRTRGRTPRRDHGVVGRRY